jgi:anthranilate synthase component II
MLEREDVTVDVILEKELDGYDVKCYDKIIFSPGPGLPDEAPNMLRLIEQYFDKKPMLGVCLGMQAIGVVFGAKLVNLTHVKHGVSEKIKKTESSMLFNGLEDEFEVGLYHSWSVLLAENSPLVPLAFNSEGVLMACKHVEYPVYGVQFHPESIMSRKGGEILSNFLSL